MNAVANANLPRRQIPGWFIVLAVLLTMAVTVFVIMKRNPNKWPAKAVEMPTLVAQSASPMMAATAAPQSPYHVVAATKAAPPIPAGSSAMHEDRGACALCHQVVDAVGNTVPAISAYSALPHPYKGGLCINCHRTIPAPTNDLLPMAATQPAAPARQPTEAAWMGLEVGPVTPLTIEQYQIPKGVKGVVVAEAEGQAGLANVQAGDVVVAVNGSTISDMNTFVAATENGALRGGNMHVLRGGKFLEVVLADPAKQKQQQQLQPQQQQQQQLPGAPAQNFQPAAQGMGGGGFGGQGGQGGQFQAAGQGGQFQGAGQGGTCPPGRF